MSTEDMARANIRLNDNQKLVLADIRRRGRNKVSVRDSRAKKIKKHRDIDKKSGGHCNRNTETETLPRATGRGETDRRDNAKQKEGGDFKRTWIYISDARSGSGQRRTSLDREKNTVKHLAKESVMESK